MESSKRNIITRLAVTFMEKVNNSANRVHAIEELFALQETSDIIVVIPVQFTSICDITNEYIWLTLRLMIAYLHTGFISIDQ